MSDRIAVVNHGKIMQLATPQVLYEHPANRFVADFIGDSTFLPVTRNGDQITYGNKPLIHEGGLPDAHSLVLMVRPERMRLKGSGNADGANLFDATVSDIVYQGDSYLMYAHLADGSEIGVRGAIRGGTVSGLPAAGEPVTLALDAVDTILIDGSDD